MSEINKDFEGQVFIVTGAASGIGRATALLCAQRGAKVIVSDVQVEAGEKTVDLIRFENGEAEFVLCDVANYESVMHLFASCLQHYGRLDAIVNNAGIGGDLEFMHRYSHDSYHDIIAINQTGVFYCMQEALKIFLAQKEGGAIVNTSSVAGVGAAPRMSAYAASKHAVIGMTRSAATEYGKYKIRVNAVCPTVIDTPMGQGYVEGNEAIIEMIKASIPMKRFGLAEEVAQTIAWLCSKESSFVTGMALRVDGGMKA